MTGFAKFTPLPLVELYVELQADEAEISQAYSYNILISTLTGGHTLLTNYCLCIICAQTRALGTVWPKGEETVTAGT